MLACSVLIGTMLAAVLELRDKLSSQSQLSLFPDLCSYSDGTLFLPLVPPE